MSSEYLIAEYFRGVHTFNSNHGSEENPTRSSIDEYGSLAADTLNHVLGAFDQGGLGTSLVVYSVKKIASGFKSMLEFTGIKEYNFLSEEDLDALHEVNTAMAEFCRGDFWRGVFNYRNRLPQDQKEAWENQLVNILTSLRELAIDLDKVDTEIIVFFRRITYTPRTAEETYQKEAIKVIRRNIFEEMKKRIDILSSIIQSLKYKAPLLIDTLLLHITGRSGASSASDLEQSVQDERNYEKILLEQSETPKIQKYIREAATRQDFYRDVEIELQQRIDEKAAQTRTQLQYASVNHGLEGGSFMQSRTVRNRVRPQEVRDINRVAMRYPPQNFFQRLFN